MTMPIKTMFSQALFEAKATTPEAIGTIRILADGRKFRLAKAGAAALSPGMAATATPSCASDASGQASTTAVRAARWAGDRDDTQAPVETMARPPR